MHARIALGFVYYRQQAAATHWILPQPPFQMRVVAPKNRKRLAVRTRRGIPLLSLPGICIFTCVAVCCRVWCCSLPGLCISAFVFMSTFVYLFTYAWTHDHTHTHAQTTYIHIAHTTHTHRAHNAHATHTHKHTHTHKQTERTSPLKFDPVCALISSTGQR